MNKHYGNQKSIQGNLLIAIVLNSLIVTGELIGGILSNSLALISDAMHNLGDLFALVLSYIASKMTFWKANQKKSFGYIRAEIIVAFINSLTLVLIGAYIIYEAAGRLLNPTGVAGLWIIIIAGISFIANAFSTYVLHKQSKINLSVKSSFLHMFYDALHSLLVMMAGVLIYLYDLLILDPVISIVIGLFIIKSAWNVVLETVNILSEGTPAEIQLKEVSDFIESFNEVKSVHHLHVWTLSSDFKALTAHVVIEDQVLSSAYLIIDKIEKGLEEKFGINHPTIQLEADLKDEHSKLIQLD